ncbi:hypothetical protein JCM8097_005562 [Rhodosporidiobolus ruineniae]
MLPSVASTRPLAFARRSFLSANLLALSSLTRTLSTSAPTFKALAHLKIDLPSPSSAPRKPAELDEAAVAQKRREGKLGALGGAVADAVRSEQSSEGAEEVVMGWRKGRTMKSLSLEGKTCVVTHPHSSIALTLAATFLEAGASDLVLVSTRTSRPRNETTSSSRDNTASDGDGEPKPLASTTGTSFTPTFRRADPAPAPSPAEQLRTLAEQSGWRYARVEELMVEGEEPHRLERAVEEVEEMLGGRKVDVLCAGPPKDEEDAAAHVPLLSLFASSMSSPPASSPYAPPASSRSMILLSTPYGPRVDLPQPQLLSHAPPAPQPKRKAGAAEMSRLAGVLGADWAKRGVRVNCISPGFLRTPEVEALLEGDPSLEGQWKNATPLGRVGGVEELKGAAVLLASDASRFTTGTTLTIDGGFSTV